MSKHIVQNNNQIVTVFHLRETTPKIDRVAQIELCRFLVVVSLVQITLTMPPPITPKLVSQCHLNNILLDI